MVFLTCGFLVVGDEIIRLLFEHGMFSQGASQQTYFCLVAYMVGLAPTSLATVYASFFYAMKEYKKPSLVSVYCLIANLILNALFIFGFKMGSWSVAASTSMCSFLNVYLLKQALVSMDLSTKIDLKFLFQNYGIAILATLIVVPIKGLLHAYNPLLSLGVLSISFVLAYAAFCKLLKFAQPLDLFYSLMPSKQSKSS